MPEARSESPRSSGNSVWTGVPSFLDALIRGRAWTAQAACADTELNFVVDPRTEANSPTTIATLLEVCAGCPVRRTCLVDALSVTGWTPEGIWGGSTIEERRHAMPRASGSKASREDRASGPREVFYVGDTKANFVKRIADDFEASFETRLKSWQRKARRHRAELRRRAALREAMGASGPRGGCVA